MSRAGHVQNVYIEDNTLFELNYSCLWVANQEKSRRMGGSTRLSYKSLQMDEQEL